MASPNVFVIDDEDLVREAIAALLREADISVIGGAASGEEALTRLATLQPEVVLLDVNLPGINGIDVLRSIKTERPDVRVIMLTVSDSDEHVFEALGAGADGYLLKTTPPRDFVRHVVDAASGTPALSHSVAGRVIRQFRRTGEAKAPPRGQPGADLSARELQVLELLTEARTNREIAAELSITERTVNYHVSNLFLKLGARNRVEAATVALRSGLVTLPDPRPPS